MSGDINRPEILTEMTVTELSDLEQQFDEGDRDTFDILVDSFGWTKEQADEVWNWFSQRPPQPSDFEAASP